MKKIILTVAVAFTTLIACAQFSVMSTISEPGNGASWEMDNFTNDLAVGYQATDKIMLGLQKSGDDYNLMGRYNMAKNMYLSAEMPMDDSTNSMTLGVGVSIKVWNNLYIEPNYTRTEDEDGFNVGLAYRFNN